MRKPDREGTAPVVCILLIQGSLCVAVPLFILLYIYAAIQATPPPLELWLSLGFIGILCVIYFIAKKGYLVAAQWILILLYQLIATTVLVYWGLESMVGILTASLAIAIPGILLPPRHILTVAIITFCVLISVCLLNTFGYITPHPYITNPAPTILDVLIYLTILALFVLLSMASSQQHTKDLDRARRAEDMVRRQKEKLKTELDTQSIRLRQSQLQEIQQLYKFAAIGQSTLATLHELSNHLSVLNLDISDLKQQHKHSKAIASAEASIDYINTMIRKIRVQLSTHANPKPFDVIATIQRAISDIQPQFTLQGVTLHKSIPKTNSKHSIFGDPTSLMHVVTILLKNALDACRHVPHATVDVTVRCNSASIYIDISDSGSGIPLEFRSSLFNPVVSSKPTGLGVGLYIAKHLLHTQLNGSIKLLANPQLTIFRVKLRHS